MNMLFAISADRRLVAISRVLIVLMVSALTIAGTAAGQGSSASAPEQPNEEPAQSDAATGLVEFLQQTRIGVNFDGYYSLNTNDPIGRINLLRAYDVSSDSFSLNQVGIVIDHAPDPDHGRRAGVRVDFMYGQATETLQGNAANESRPQVYRPLFQAYGSYVFPLGKGLQVDFGKFASALGIEGNYTKDQINYSRSYFFDFLPFYHMGFRSSYSVNDRVTLTYWLVNGTQQTEDFNGFKSQAAIVTVKPNPAVTWNVNYYTGKEGRDLVPALNPGLPSLPGQPGLSAEPVVNPDPSRLHIIDTYTTWNAGSRITLAGEADYVTLRGSSMASQLRGGVGYAEYRIRSFFRLGARATLLADDDGLFTGASQQLHEVTGTATWLPDSHFMVRAEWRRDASNHAFFLTDDANVRDNAQTTLTLGLIWTIGNKAGVW